MRVRALVVGGFLAWVGPWLEVVEGAKLAAAIKAKKDANERAEKEVQLTPEEIEKQRELALEVENDLNKLLGDNKEYIKHKLEADAQENAEEYDANKLEDEDLWKNEYQSFLRAEQHKRFWERTGIAAATGGLLSLLSLGMQRSSDSPIGDPFGADSRAALQKRKAATLALLGGAGALLGFLMRRHNKRKQKYHDHRLGRMHFEAKAGVRPSEHSVLGPEDAEILKKKKTEKEKNDER